MMNFEQRLNAFSILGLFLKNYKTTLPENIQFLEKYKPQLANIIKEQHIYNAFFTEEFVDKAQHPEQGILVVGELVSRYQGWAEGSLESVNAVLTKRWIKTMC